MNVTKSVENCGFGHITEETLNGKLNFLRICFRGKFLKNSLGACFIKYMSAIARLKNVDAKIHHIKKYMN